MNTIGTTETSRENRWVGRPVPRKEDEKFLKGRGRYVDDIVLPHQLFATFVRSPHAHAEILGVDISEAIKSKGVKACYTADDIADLPDVPPNWVMPDSKVKGRPPLARKTVKHHGEAVAVIVAESLAQAVDAAQCVKVDYKTKPAIVSQFEAAAAISAQIHDDVPGNLATQMSVGAGFDLAAAEADHIFTMNVDNQRLIPFSIEPRAVNANYNPITGRMDFYTAQQIPHVLKKMLAATLKFPEHKLRVISPDVGGGFGPKMHFYPEELVLAWVAIKIGRAVKWTETRSENISATTHGRDHAMTAQIAVKNNGRILGIKTDASANIGAYLSSMGTGVPTINVGMFLNGVYDIPHSEALIRCFYTNTTPVDAYRGAGRPEAAYLIERAIGRVAQELEIDESEIRFRNFIKAEQLPYKQVVGTTLDSGAYENTLSLALQRIKYDDLRADQQRKREQGRLVGIGISNYTETCGVGIGALLSFVGFDRGGFESALVRVHPDGSVTIFSGSHSHGQGHATTFSQIAADELGFPLECIEVVQGDTDKVPTGVGTFNSRSVAVGGSAVKVACGRIAEKMKQIAAFLLGAEPDQVVVFNGIFSTQDGRSSLAAADIASEAWTGGRIPPEFGIGLEETEFYHPTGLGSPYGVHIAVLEIDAETGEVDLQQYLAIDDCGVIINPLLAAGQVHGGVAQGIGAALFETAGYDGDGVPIIDPAIPRFDQLISIETDFEVSPTPTNPLGAKGIGEAGTIAAPPRHRQRCNRCSVAARCQRDRYAVYT